MCFLDAALLWRNGSISLGLSLRLSCDERERQRRAHNASTHRTHEKAGARVESFKDRQSLTAAAAVLFDMYLRASSLVRCLYIRSHMHLCVDYASQERLTLFSLPIDL